MLLVEINTFYKEHSVFRLALVQIGKIQLLIIASLALKDVTFAVGQIVINAHLVKRIL